MTFEEFLAYIRSPEHIGNYCTDEYWHRRYDELQDKSFEAIQKEMFVMAVRAVAAHYTTYEHRKHINKGDFYERR